MDQNTHVSLTSTFCLLAVIKQQISLGKLSGQHGIVTTGIAGMGRIFTGISQVSTRHLHRDSNSLAHGTWRT